MKLSQPRIAPLTEAEWTDEQREVLEPVQREGRVYNVRATLSRHWVASKKFGVSGSNIMGDTSTLLPRQREILILRIGWLCQAEYEWGSMCCTAGTPGSPTKRSRASKQGRMLKAGTRLTPACCELQMNCMQTLLSAMQPGPP